MPEHPWRMLYIAPDIVLDLPAALSGAGFEGDYLGIWAKMDAPDAAKDRRRIEAGFGKFGFHPARPSRLPFGLRQIRDLWFFVSTALVLTRQRGCYDVVVTYAPYRTGLAGLLIKWLTGARLIIEFPLDPSRVFRYDHSATGRLKHLVSPGFARWMARKADRIMVLYPQQVKELGLPDGVRYSVVHPFIRFRSVPTDILPTKTILLLGMPLRLKGADLLIQAFAAIVPRHPDYSLTIAGTDEDLSEFRALAGNLPVRFVGRLDHTDALAALASCAVFVLPSRTEGVPRVILEAMAAGRPVVASDVGGIPYLVRHGETGLLFPSGDAVALAAQLERLLSDPDLAARLAGAGQVMARGGFTEEHIARQWSEAVAATVGKPG